jgi:hypothetical protein
MRRARLSYEAFSRFLQIVKELNSGNSRDDTLRRARELFGVANADLYGEPRAAAAGRAAWAACRLNQGWGHSLVRMLLAGGSEGGSAAVAAAGMFQNMLSRNMSPQR